MLKIDLRASISGSPISLKSSRGISFGPHALPFSIFLIFFEFSPSKISFPDSKPQYVRAEDVFCGPANSSACLVLQYLLSNIFSPISFSRNPELNRTVFYRNFPNSSVELFRVLAPYFFYFLALLIQILKFSRIAWPAFFLVRNVV